MRNKKIFVLKIVWRKSIATLHCLTQAVQRANLRRTAGDPTWVTHWIPNPLIIGSQGADCGWEEWSTKLDIK